MDRNQRNVLILGVLAIVLLIVGFWFLLLGPLLQRLDETAQERDDKQAQAAQLEQEIQDLEAIRDEAPEIERQLLELSKRIPAQPEIPTLTVQLGEIADSAGVTQLSLVPGDPAPPPGGGDYTVVPVTMSFEGTYTELREFLLQVRNLVRLVTVNEVSYEPVETGEETTTTATGADRLLQVEIQAEVYFQPEDSAAPTTPSGTPVAPPPTPETTTPEATDAG